MGNEQGLRERKKRQRRATIEEVALRLFQVQGFDAVTVEEIAAGAQIAPRTFFTYFPTKEDVVLADYGVRLERILTELEGRPPSEPAWPALRAAFMAVAADYGERREDLSVRFRIMAATPSVYARSLQLQAGWEDSLTVVLAYRTERQSDDLGCRLIASAALAAMRSSLRHWIATGHAADMPDLLAASFDAIHRGLDDVPRLG